MGSDVSPFVTPLQPCDDFVARLAERRKEGHWKMDKIQSAADLVSAQADTSKRDRCYVVPLDTSAAEPALIGVAEQRLTHGVGVIFAARNHAAGPGRRGARGGAALNDIEEHRNNVARALIGWCAPGAVFPVTYRRGTLLRFDAAAATIWWQDEFRVETRWWPEHEPSTGDAPDGDDD